MVGGVVMAVAATIGLVDYSQFLFCFPVQSGDGSVKRRKT
jgi:hypothetical protein